jgi:RNA polymerase sigma-B factor
MAYGKELKKMFDGVRLTEEQRKMTLDNLNLVDHILQNQMKIPPYSNIYEDCQQEGRLGLIYAVIRFDESRGFEFSTYAYKTVMGFIQRYIRDFIYGRIKVSRNIKDLIKKVVPLYYDGYTSNEIILKLHITDEEYIGILNLLGMKNLESPVAQNDRDEPLQLLDVLGKPDTGITDVFGEERVTECIEKTASCYKNLRDRNIWYEYAYPAYYGERVTNVKLAEKYNLSQPQVNRILSKGKNVLRKYLQEDE